MLGEGLDSGMSRVQRGAAIDQGISRLQHHEIVSTPPTLLKTMKTRNSHKKTGKRLRTCWLKSMDPLNPMDWSKSK